MLLGMDWHSSANRYKGHINVFDFDEDRSFCSAFQLPDCFEWRDSGLPRAALVYKRECGWDFAPDEAGIWLCYYLPTDGSGGSNEWYYNGNLVGFAILHDRDEDGKYESLAHLWTAKAARRHGVAAKLIAYGRQHFPLRHAEGPLTKAGRGLLEKVWPALFAKDKPVED